MVLRLIGLWTPVVGFMAAVWFLSDAVSLETPELFSDKALHFLAFGAFGVANMRAFHGGFGRPRVGPTLAAVALTVGFGALDEWRQAGVDLRTASWGDWIADLAGAVAAYLCIHFYDRGRRGQESR